MRADPRPKTMTKRRRNNMSGTVNSNTISPDTLSAEYVHPANCSFATAENGFLTATINGTLYKRVILTRSLPLFFPDDYICITDADRNEIGIIEHISEFPEEQQKALKNELSQRYYCPVVDEILSVKDKMGNFYFDVKIGDFKKSFTVKDIARSIRQIGNSVYITDIEGNRFKIEDYEKIPPKSRRKIEPYLY